MIRNPLVSAFHSLNIDVACSSDEQLPYEPQPEVEKIEVVVQGYDSEKHIAPVSQPVAEEMPAGILDSTDWNSRGSGLSTPFTNLIVGPPIHGHRPPIERSSSLEVHVSSPAPLEGDTSCLPEILLDETPTRIQDLGIDEVISPINDEQALQETTNDLDLPILTPETSHSRTNYWTSPSPMKLEVQQLNSPPGITPSPHLATIEQAFEAQEMPQPPHRQANKSWASPHPMLLDIRQMDGSFISASYPHLATIQEGSDAKLTPQSPTKGLVPIAYHSASTHEDSDDSKNQNKYSIPSHATCDIKLRSKYPPCWTTGDGLVIVPSIPGEPSEETYKLTASNDHPCRALLHDSANDQFSVASLNPNITAYRKGKHLRRNK